MTESSPEVTVVNPSFSKRLVRRLRSAARPLLTRLFPPLRILPSPTPELALLSLQQVRAENRFATHLVCWAAVGSALVAGNLLIDGPRDFWSPGPVIFWALAVAAHGYTTLVRRRRRYEARHRRLREAGAGGDAVDPGGTGVGRLRRKLLHAAEEAREALRADSPEIATEITRGETEALGVVAWLDEAEPLAKGGRLDRRLRRQAAERLSQPGHRSRGELERLVAELDAAESRRAALEHEAGERRANVESFVLAVENVKLAHSGGDVAPAVEAPIRERVALLTGPRAGTRLQQEVQLARDLQRSILPATAPAVAGLEVTHVYRPSSEVGGDFYDFYATDACRLLIALGDASGHGLDSSMVSSMAKSALYMQVSARRPLEEAMAELNRMMCDTLGRRRLMTLTLLELDVERRAAKWVNAGQVYPLLRRRGQLIELSQPGYPLGVRRQMRYAVREIGLEPGDRLLLSTDGYVEAADAEGEPYGFERLAERFAELPDGDAQAALDALVADLDRYLGKAPPQDDFTLISLAFEP